MPTPITIRQTGKDDNGFDATIQFGAHGEAISVRVDNPFSAQQEQELEWYFEEWLNFPYTDQVRAEAAARSIRAYGEKLFAQIFLDARATDREYQRLRGEDLLLEIVGPPEFHALHWEALHDPDSEHPLAVNTTLVRKNSQNVTYRADVQAAPHLRVLLVTARPAGKRDVSYRTISRPLVEALEIGEVAAQIDIVRPGTFQALVTHLDDVRDRHGEGYYHLIHLDMHGALLTYAQYTGLAEEHTINDHSFRGTDFAQSPVEPYDGLRAFVFFDDAANTADEHSAGHPVSAEDLARLLNLRQIPIVVLNACQSGKQVGDAETSVGSRLIAAGVQLVVAMGYSVTVTAARLLMTTLYRQLLDGHDPAVAIRRGRLQLYHDKDRQAAFGQRIRLEDWMLPVIYQNRPVTFPKDAFRGGSPLAAAEYRPPRTTYGFVGRDVDILQIERRLLHRRNLLLVRGMGGAGKSTLLHHLGWWWQKTRFVERVFYFGYDAKAYHLAEMVQRMGHDLGLDLSGRAAEDRAAVLRALKSRRHLLILDNLESVTGAALSVQNTLPAAAQAEVRDFLGDLVGGRTLVLLGSRGDESWLQPHPLRPQADIYDLPGLDYTAQSELAQAILAAVGAPRYPELDAHRADFRRLLKLLGGYPLALEVVLANLAHATPAQVIERLQAADVNLDNRQEAAQKTESILKCIDYSHSNLSPAAQELLLCLAPFTGVINVSWLAQYTSQLQAQPVLADLPFDQWHTVLNEAMRWGLLQPHEELRGYLRLQPVFPYFLKTRLADAAQAERKMAVETAFRLHYDDIGDALIAAMNSRNPGEKQTGVALASVEYENFATALFTALSARAGIFNLYGTLSNYINLVNDHRRGLEIGLQILASLDEIQELELPKGYHEELARLTGDIGNRFLATKQYQKAAESYERSIAFTKRAVLDEEPKQKLIASTLHQLGIVAQEQRQWPTAEHYFKEALQIFIDFNDSFSQARTLHHLGIVAQDQRQWPTAERYFKEALQIFIDFNDSFSQARTLHHLGNVAQEQRQWPAAERYFKDALQIKIDFNDRFSQASTLGQLGIVAQEQRQWPAAEHYFKDALQIFIAFNDRFSQAITLHQLGIVAQEQRQWPAAERYFKDALQIFIAFNDRFSQATPLHQLGIVAQEQRQWSAAERYFKDALQIYIDFNDRFSQARTLHQLGRVAEDREDWEQASIYAVDAAAIFAAYQDQYSLGVVLRTLSRLRAHSPAVVDKVAAALGVTGAEAAALLAVDSE